MCFKEERHVRSVHIVWLLIGPALSLSVSWEGELFQMLFHNKRMGQC